MAKFWCINCQKEVDGVSIFGKREGVCGLCWKETLASIVANPDDTGYSVIKQMVGEAQRKAQQTGQTGNIEVLRTSVNSSGEYQCQVLVYNTNTGFYRVC